MLEKSPTVCVCKAKVFLFGWVLVASFFSPSACAQLLVFTDRAAFQQALGTTATLDNFGSYVPGQISQGGQLGDFGYGFSPASTLPMITADGFGNPVLGGAPYKVFVGGDQVTLTNASTHGAVTALGVDFAYAPAADIIPANTFAITILNGSATGLSVGSPVLPAAGGTGFIGFIANPGIQCTVARFGATQTDTNTIVPACQVNDLIYHNGAITPVLLNSAKLSGQNIVVQGGGGLAGGRFVFLATTNLTLPASQWSAVATNVFDASGNFLLTRSRTQPREFFRVKPY